MQVGTPNLMDCFDVTLTEGELDAFLAHIGAGLDDAGLPPLPDGFGADLGMQMLPHDDPSPSSTSSESTPQQGMSATLPSSSSPSLQPGDSQGNALPTAGSSAQLQAAVKPEPVATMEQQFAAQHLQAGSCSPLQPGGGSGSVSSGGWQGASAAAPAGCAALPAPSQLLPAAGSAPGAWLAPGVLCATAQVQPAAGQQPVQRGLLQPLPAMVRQPQVIVQQQAAHKSQPTPAAAAGRQHAGRQLSARQASLQSHTSTAAAAAPAAQALPAPPAALARNGSAKLGARDGAAAKAQVSHSTVEKQRRDRLNSLIDELSDIVPPVDPKYGNDVTSVRRPKHVVLADTINLLRAMQAKLHLEEAEICTLKEQAATVGAIAAQQAHSGGQHQSSSGDCFDDRDVDMLPEPPTPQCGVLVEPGIGCLYVKVNCVDRKGLLGDVVAALKALPLQIMTAAVTTKDGRVHDVFEVRADDASVSATEIQAAVHMALFAPGGLRGKRMRHSGQAGDSGAE